jgi:uncharacterized protein with PhoU and TrkA domain
MKLWKKKEFEEVEYEPKTVREILTEMKDTSELIVDLAYAALLFNSREIADEVRLLEVQMDELKYQLEMTVMLAARDPEDAEKLAAVLQVANATEHISNAAGDIVNLLKIPVKKRPFLSSLLKEGDEIISFVKVPREMEMERLEELYETVSPGIRVLAVKRHKRWIYDPEDAFRIRGGDALVVTGPESAIDELRTHLGVKK